MMHKLKRLIIAAALFVTASCAGLGEQVERGGSATKSGDRLEALKLDLWNRWSKHVVEPTIPQMARGARTVHSQFSRFNLLNWGSPDVVAGGKVYPAQNSIDPITVEYIYVLDEAGRPLTMALRDSEKRDISQGEFRYSTDEIEFVEFNLESKIPSLYERVTFRDGIRTSYQRLAENIGGMIPPRWRNLDRRELARQFQASRLNYYLSVEAYDVADGRIRGGESLMEGSGSGSRFALDFAYLADGQLNSVSRRYPDGSVQTLFLRRSNRTLDELTNDLARRIADRVMGEMRRRTFGAPVIGIELSYQSGNELPFVTYLTEADNLAEFPITDASVTQREIPVREEHVGPQIAEFMARIEEEDDLSADTRMVRRAARLINLEANPGFPRAKDFVAYAIDWEIAGNGTQLVQLLEECGASKAAIDSWKKRGWLSQ
jgi:hypothetical protein